MNLQKVNLTGCGNITGHRADLEKELEKHGRTGKLELFMDDKEHDKGFEICNIVFNVI